MYNISMSFIYGSLQRIKFVYKFILIGDAYGGKTSISRILRNHGFQEETKSTIGIDFMSTILTIKDNNIKLQIWDTAGQEIYNSIIKRYFQDIIGCIIVLDGLSECRLINQLKYWLKQNNENSNNLENVEYLIFINKVDHIDVQKKLEEMSEIREYCDEYNFLVYETSAKTNLNINEGLYDLTNRIHTKTHKNKKKIKGISKMEDLYEDIDISIMTDPDDIKEETKCDNCIIS